MNTSKRTKKPVGIYLLIALVTFLVAVLLINTGPVKRTEFSIRDQLFEIRGPLSVEDSPIVLVAISEGADSEIPYKYPWPASVHAKLVENLTEAGAKVILFDVLLTEPDELNPRNDTLLAKAIRDHGRVVLAADVERTESRRGEELVPVFPHLLLREYNPNPMGFVHTIPSVDGSVRSYSFGRRYLGNEYYMLGIEGVKLFRDIADDQVDALDGTSESEHFHVGEYAIRRENLNSFIINYYGPEGIFPTISYDKVVDDEEFTTVMEEDAFEMNLFDDPLTGEGLLHDGIFKDKIVIVGSTMPVLQDFHSTPFSSADLPRPGFEIHANAIQTILDGNYIVSQSTLSQFLMMFILSFIVVFYNRYLGAGWGFLITAATMGLYYFTAIQIFLYFQMFIFVSGAFISLFIGQVATVGYEYVIEQREKRRIKGMFSSYVSPTLVDQMVASKEEPTLGGEETYMTAFFSDIVSFSSFSEILEPKQLVALINEYLTAMTDILNEQGGTLDKFIGDAIVAFFGAPIMVEDHARRACVTSQLMSRELRRLKEKWKADNWPDIVWQMQHRIGLNTGDMVTGNMGSIRRFNYTMMGDNVNLAARCESGAKSYNVYTMVTEATKLEAQRYGDECLYRFLDNIVVKGRTQPVKVFEIVGLKEDADQQLYDCVGIYEEAMAKYMNQEWDAAIELFEQARTLEKDQMNPTQIFISRCNLMKVKPPGDDWNGVFVMKSK